MEEGRVLNRPESNFAESLRRERRTAERLYTAPRRWSEQVVIHRRPILPKLYMPTLLAIGFLAMGYTGNWGALPFVLIGAVFV